MKIYYVANARMPSEKAHGIQLAKMCEAFLLAGADLELVLPNRRKSSNDLKEFYSLSVNIPVKRLWVLNWGFVISSFTFMVSYYFYLLNKKDCIVYTIDMDSFSFLPIRFLGMKYYSELHDSKDKSIFWNYFLGKASGLITINKLIKENIIKNFKIDPLKIIVQPNGIDLKMFLGIEKIDARRKLNIEEDKKIAVYVGREISWKGMEILEEVEKIIPGIIRKVTDRPYQEIPLWLSAADILLVLGTKMNNYSYLYTSPMKIFEYMASSRPILAADTPANREILSENEATFYAPDNADDFARKIIYMLSRPPELKFKSENARRKVEEYEWSRRGRSILGMINK